MLRAGCHGSAAKPSVEPAGPSVEPTDDGTKTHSGRVAGVLPIPPRPQEGRGARGGVRRLTSPADGPKPQKRQAGATGRKTFESAKAQKRPELATNRWPDATLKVRDERAAVAFWRNRDNRARVGLRFDVSREKG